MIDSIDCAKCNVYSKCIENKDKTGKHICFGFEPIEKPQTNEEWFDSLTTKEKAKALDLLMDGMSNLRFEIEEILNNGDFDMTHEEAVEVWLKQQHREEQP